MSPLPQSVIQLEGLLGQTRFTLGDREVTVESERPFLRRRASFPFDTVDRNLGSEVRPYWGYPIAAAILVVAASVPGLLERLPGRATALYPPAACGLALAALAAFLLHRRRRTVFRNYFTSAKLFEMTPSVAATPVGRQIVNRVLFAESGGLPLVYNYVEYDGGRKLVCAAEPAPLERLFLGLLEAIPDEVGVALVVVRGDRDEAEYGNTKVRRERVRGAFEEYRDILTLDGMADFCIYKEGEFEIVFDNHRLIEIYGRNEPFLPIVEGQGFVFNRAYTPRYLHYHVHNVNPPENFDERVEQLKWNLQLR
jgi:hypothetical protein